jgi:hypothetical protein
MKRRTEGTGTNLLAQAVLAANTEVQTVSRGIGHDTRLGLRK